MVPGSIPGDRILQRLKVLEPQALVTSHEPIPKLATSVETMYSTTKPLKHEKTTLNADPLPVRPGNEIEHCCQHFDPSRPCRSPQKKDHTVFCMACYLPSLNIVPPLDNTMDIDLPRPCFLKTKYADAYAETRDRTGDLQIFSLTLSQLSYRGLIIPKSL